MNDTDIDTCLPGDVEQHQAIRSPPTHPARTGESLTPSGSTYSDSQDPLKRKRGYTSADLERSPQKRPRTAPEENNPDTPAEVHQQVAPYPNLVDSADMDAEIFKDARLQPALALTRMTRMVGTAMETFNKSLEHRHDQSES